GGRGWPEGDLQARSVEEAEGHRHDHYRGRTGGREGESSARHLRTRQGHLEVVYLGARRHRPAQGVLDQGGGQPHAGHPQKGEAVTGDSDSSTTPVPPLPSAGGDHVRGCWVLDLLLGKEYAMTLKGTDRASRPRPSRLVGKTTVRCVTKTSAST